MSIRKPSAPAIDRQAAARAIDDFLRALGRSSALEPELVGTGERVAEAYANELCAGYAVDVDALAAEHTLTSSSTGVVLLRRLPLATLCPHHLLPAEGFASIAYQPAGRLMGLGGIAGVVEALARRLVLQEDLGEQVATALAQALSPTWLLVHLQLRHGCLRLRGSRSHGALVDTFTRRGTPPESMAATLLAGVTS